MATKGAGSKPYRLLLMPPAAEELEDIFAYIEGALSAPGAARRLMRDIDDAFARIVRMPRSCSKSRDVILEVKGYRELAVHNYVAYYLVDEDARTVLVMRVLCGGRDRNNLV